MDVVLGVSMTPTAVRMTLVEGDHADGVTLDRSSFDVPRGVGPAASDAPEQLVAAILGTRESAIEGGHRLAATGVAWTDHASAARVRQALHAQRVDGVVLVSELHAASALAQAIGRAAACERIALLLLERETATLAVVRTADGAVVRLTNRRLRAPGSVGELQDMLSRLEAGAEPPQAIFAVGSGVDAVELRSQIAAWTALPVHAPQDGAFALARGAALAAVNIPRYDASTVWLLPVDEGPTVAAADYPGYGAVDTDAGEDLVTVADGPDDEPERSPFLLLCGALSTVLVLGLVALILAMAVATKPRADQVPAPGESAVVTDGPGPAPPQAQPAPGPEPLQTIQAPVPVVQEVPRTVFVAPAQEVPRTVSAAPAAPAPVPVKAPEPTPSSVAPAPALPPIVVPIPIIPPRLPAIFQMPARSTPATPASTTTAPSNPSVAQPSSPATTSSAPTSTTVAPTTSTPETTATPSATTTTTTTAAPSAPFVN